MGDYYYLLILPALRKVKLSGIELEVVSFSTKSIEFEPILVRTPLQLETKDPH
jgi:hypothetical protein